MMGNGLITKCTEKEYFHGLMAKNILVSISRIKKRDTVNFIGLMGKYIKDSGGIVSKMAKDLLQAMVLLLY